MNMNSQKHSVNTTSKDHLRLLVTVECIDLELANSSISTQQRFVFGFDLNLRPSIKDILDDLHSKLIPELDDVRLELYLRSSAEYFVPPWSNTRDVLHGDDQVILRIRKIGRVENENENGALEKKEKRKGKRKLEENGDGTVEINGVPTTNVDQKPIEEPRKEKKKKKNKHRSPDQTSRSIIDQSSIADQQSEAARSIDNSPKKKQKTSTNGDVYDKAIVIRNGNGKIQHVYFDSPSPPESPEVKNEKEKLGDRLEKSVGEIEKSKKEKSVNESSTSTSMVKKSVEQIPKKSTEQLKSKALEKAKKFSTLIDQTTTCGNLGKPKSGLDESSIQISTTVVVTKDQKKPKGGGNRYSNVSMLVEKPEIPVPTATSTPVQDKNGAITGQLDQCMVTENHVQSQPEGSASKIITSMASPIITDPIINNGDKQQKPLDDSWAPSKPILEYPPIKHPGGLRIGDLLAYKVMELNELDCTPGISDWKIGRLEEFDPVELELVIKLFTGEARCEVPLKFRFVEKEELNGEEEYGIEKDRDQEDHQKEKKQEDVVFWREIVEARLLQK